MAASSSETTAVLEPGVFIRPQTNTEDVIRLAKDLYNLEEISITEFNAYDDKNYHITSSKSEQQSTLWEHGYVLKITNTLDSTKLSFIDAQNELMLYLGSRGILCPQPVKNTNGTYYSVEKMYHKVDGKNTKEYNQHVVRLLTYLPGVILHQVECTNQLFYQAGRYIGNVDNVLKGFHHEAYDTHKSLWCMESVPMLRKFLFAIKDEKRNAMITQILDTFDAEVVPKIPTLEQGMLHGDFNEQNVLARLKTEDGDEGGWEIHGLLDFGDTHYSCYVFELAIAMCYMMLQVTTGDQLEAGGHVLAGYNRERPLSREEFHLLKVCVCGRLCQSLVLGAYSHLQDPDNTYILTTQSKGWTLLTLLHNTPQQQLEGIWKQTVFSYETEENTVACSFGK